jgi:hypothetical protein
LGWQPEEVKVHTIESQLTSAPAEYKYINVRKITPAAYATGNITAYANHRHQREDAIPASK